MMNCLCKGEEIGIERDNVMVSVMCITYNHERFIRQALEGFVMQETSFSFEVLVHDDASTDHTADIIREYETKYPNIIKAIYQRENQYSKGTNIAQTFLLPHAKGKYIAWCEGDDYWTDSHKLQMQVDAMESNQECVACFCKVEWVNVKGESKNKWFPKQERNSGIFMKDDYLNYCLDPGPLQGFPWQISGFIVKKSVYQAYMDKQPYYKSFFITIGDTPMFLYVGTKGDVYYIDKVMSKYRAGTPGSWGERTGNDVKRKAIIYKNSAKGFKEFDAYTNGKYREKAKIAEEFSEFSSYRIVHDIKGMKLSEMKQYYNLLSSKEKALHHILYYFPWLEKPYKTVYRFLKE